MPATLSPAARAALDALAAWHCSTRRDARALLATWSHRHTLTAADVAAALASSGARS
jgi:hypothetical protein